MKHLSKIAILAGALAVSAAPALAAPPVNQGTSHIPVNQGTQHNPNVPSGSLPANAKGYGVYCNTESKKHVDGQKGTPFSVCVTAMAKLAHGKSNNPASACKAESRVHVEGQKGTPFSLCVSAGAQLLQNH
jgi:hypothetical protein